MIPPEIPIDPATALVASLLAALTGRPVAELAAGIAEAGVPDGQAVEDAACLSFAVLRPDAGG